MKKIILVSLFLSSYAIALEKPDFMLMGMNFIPEREAFNLCSSPTEDDGLKLSFQDASLYGIGSLRWMYAGLRYSYRCWTFGGAFRDYGINDLYESSDYALIIHRLFAERYSLGMGYTRSEKNFGDNFYRSSVNMLQFSAGVKLDPVNFDATIGNISLNDADNVNGDPEILLAGSWLANEALTILGLYYRNPYHHDRILLGQNLNLNRTIIISAGLMSSPEVYYVGFEIVYKSFVFGYTFYDLADLPNCTKVTVSYR